MSASSATPITTTTTPVGHEAVVRRLGFLAAAVREGRHEGLHHAYIFGGPPGVGKFTVAQWWARKLICPSDTDCGGQCRDCRMLAGDVHPDVLVLRVPDGKALIPIEEARGMIARLSLRSSRSGPRIGIVHDAEFLTPPAQSALLKLLEEPPGFAVIILVTGNPSSLFPTVRSRCQHIAFGLLDDDSVAKVLTARGTDSFQAQAAASAARGRVDQALTYTPEGLNDRERLLLAFEAVGRGDGDLEQLVKDMLDRKANGYGLDEVLAWQLRKIRACLGAASSEPSQALQKVLESLDPTRLPALVRGGDRLQRTILSFERHINARLAIRDLLLDVRLWENTSP